VGDDATSLHNLVGGDSSKMTEGIRGDVHKTILSFLVGVGGEEKPTGRWEWPSRPQLQPTGYWAVQLGESAMYRSPSHRMTVALPQEHRMV
jgi:hypothetical protein